MKELIVYPASRAIRERLAQMREEDRMLPRLMRMDEFERRLVLLPGRRMVDPLLRIFYLREAADFREFSTLKMERDLLRFFTRSEDLFRFFEELAVEKVSPEELARADAYAEFAEHIGILERLRENYRRILEREGWSDRMFVPESYELNRGFLHSFERAEIHLEGVPGRFELELLERVAREKELHIRLRSTRFSGKVLDRFAEIGMELPREEGEILFDLREKRVLEFAPRPVEISARVLALQERYDQIAQALGEIEEMVRAGISPDRIALILPDEGMKDLFALYDRLDNLNFAKGFDYSSRREYRLLETLLEFWRTRDEKSLAMLRELGVDPERLSGLNPSAEEGAQEFFEELERAGLWRRPDPAAGGKGEEDQLWEYLHESYERFLRLFARRRLRRREWLYFWLESLREIRIDDVRGGKVTVMGVLETRGIRFDGVVIVDFNEGVVPALSGKDRFLNSAVRHFAGLPTRRDREALQKHYYARLLEGARQVSILYALSDERLPSRFLYELGLDEGERVAAPRGLLYPDVERVEGERPDPSVEDFDPASMEWSASMLRSWLECRRKFYYRYLRRLPEKPEEGIREGSLLHEALRRLYARRSSFAEEGELRMELEGILEDLLPPHAESDYLRRLWMKKLEGFLHKEIERFQAGWRVEEVEFPVRGEIAGLRFAGRVDRIDRRGEEMEILDYKTGSTVGANRKKDFEKIVDFQLSIYRLLLADRYPGAVPLFVKILEEGEREPLFAPEEMEAQLREFVGELAATRRFVAGKTEELQRCRYCPYRLLCGRGEYL
ncbi:RecB family exonuclease [Nitratifractor sp.]